MTHHIFDQKLIIFFEQPKGNENIITLLNVPENIHHERSNTAFICRQTHLNELNSAKIILLQNIESCEEVADHWARIYQQKFPDEYFEIWRQSQRLETHISWDSDQPGTCNTINQNIINDMRRKAVSMTKRWPGLTVSFPEEGRMIYHMSSNSEHAQKIQTLTFRWAERYMNKWGKINNIERKNNQHTDCQPVMLTNQKICMGVQLKKVADDEYQESNAKNKKNIPHKIRLKI